MKPKLITKNYLLVGFETSIDLKETEWLGMSQVKSNLKASLEMIENKTQPIRFLGFGWLTHPQIIQNRKTILSVYFSLEWKFRV